MSRILIIEDEIAIADLERDYLELSDFEVEVEHDGTAGLELALNEEWDLIVLDLMLPGTDGFEICQSVRSVKNVPIIMVSARKEDIDKVRGLGLGADDYITKPFSPSELVARVKAHLARYERLTGPAATSRSSPPRTSPTPPHLKNTMHWTVSDAAELHTQTSARKSCRPKSVATSAQSIRPDGSPTWDGNAAI